MPSLSGSASTFVTISTARRSTTLVSRAASVASWIGVPGPGESVLVAAGIFAAQHKLDIAEVLLVAWVAATAGGIAGWLIGMRAGRAVMSAPGPFQRARLKAVERGDEIFGRVPVLAVVLTPSWIAGIHRVRPTVFLITNALSAALWAVGIGLGAYLVGPPVVEVVDDVGWVATIGLVALVAVGRRWLETRRRRRRRRRAAPGAEPRAGCLTRRRSGTGRPGSRRSAGSTVCGLSGMSRRLFVHGLPLTSAVTLPDAPADAIGAQRLVPDVKEVAERVDPLRRGLDVDDAVRARACAASRCTDRRSPPGPRLTATTCEPGMPIPPGSARD